MSESNASETEKQLARAIVALREDVAVRSEWRDALDRELLSSPAPAFLEQQTNRGWRITPLVGIAAALVCMISGAAINDVMRRESSSAGGEEARAATVATPVSSSVGVRFSVMARGVRNVSLVGDFNGWNAEATPLELARDGQTWTTMLPLAAGRHAYAFVIDGQVVRDPSAPAAPDEDFGVPNSLVLVSNNTTSNTSSNPSNPR